ncbi:hypothetical protein DFQ11_101634 [Winogradskyella epiphytica]|uniref:Uncharacterized protein n=2 Tax=Winogradskyella epiphytica TaxID=262005 RepID=A0A2V4WZX2_9FLAO|nr:hypothetical protein DFQ11_101634 [Winogradskyella epiphytica]
MNRTRIIGLILLIIGAILPFTVETDLTDFVTGLLIGIGIALLIIGKGKRVKNDSLDSSQ